MPVYFFGAPFQWSEEVARLGFDLDDVPRCCLRDGGRPAHYAVDVLSPRLSFRGQLWLECLSHADRRRDVPAIADRWQPLCVVCGQSGITFAGDSHELVVRCRQCRSPADGHTF